MSEADVPALTSAGHGGNEPAAAGPPVWARADGVLLGLLLGAWFVALLVVGVRGEFPENDGFAHAHAVRRLIDTGKLERDAWTYTPIVTNVLWGALFAKLGGFSFVALRASSVVMGAVGLTGNYVLGRALGLGRPWSALAALAYAFMPLHLGLSYTFMTDVTYSACVVWSLAGFALAARGQRRAGYALGITAGVAAALSRQTGLVLLPVVLLALLWPRFRSARALGFAALVAALALPMALAAEALLSRFTDLRLFEVLRDSLAGPSPGFALVKHGVSSLFLLGLGGAPLIVAALAGGRVVRRAELAGAVVLAGAVIGAQFAKLGGNPFAGNVFGADGLGPRAVHCGYLAPSWPRSVWVALVVASALSGALGTLLIIREHVAIESRRLAVRAERLLLAVYFALGLVPSLVRFPFFDRYLVPVLPAWLMMLAATLERANRPGRGLVAGLGTAALIGVCSIGLTADYLSHLRARQELLRPLLSRGEDPEAIEGGFEHDGWYRYAGHTAGFEIAWEKNLWLLTRALELSGSTSPAWSHGERYLLSRCEHVPGYEAAGASVRRQWLPPGEEHLYLQRRSDDASKP